MFDPYHKWLGIPPKYRPPTLYQLLGVERDEQDPEVIEEAAIRQSAHLRTYQIGPHSELCTRLLNEVAHARQTLLDPVKRQKYDAELAKKAAAARPAPAAAAPIAATAPPPASAFADLDVAPNLRPAPGRGNGQPALRQPYPAAPVGPAGPLSGKRGLLLGAGVGAGVLALVVVIVVLSRSGPTGTPPDDPGRPPVAQNPGKDKDGQPKGGEPGPPDKNPKMTPAGFVGTPAEPFAVGTPKLVYDFPGVPNLGDFCLLPGQREIILVGSRIEKFGLADKKSLQVYGGQPPPGMIALTYAKLSADGGQLFTARCGEKVIHHWDVATGQELGQFGDHNTSVQGLDLFDGGRKLVSLESGGLRIWDVAAHKEEFCSPPGSFYRAIAVTPDGKALVSGSRTVELWDLTARAQKKIVELPGNLQSGTCLAVAADGAYALNVSQGTQTGLCFSRISDFNNIYFKNTASAVYRGMAFSVDGKYLAAATDSGAVQVWDTQKHALLHEVPGHKSLALRVAFSADGKQLFTCGVNDGFKAWQLPEKLDVASGPAPVPGALLPKIALTALTAREVEADINYVLSITNWADFPAELFQPAPGLPAVAGLPAPSSRTIMHIHTDAGQFGPFQFSGPKQLQSFAVKVRKDAAQPKTLHITLTDRQTNQVVQSEKVSLPAPGAAPTPGKIPLPTLMAQGAKVDPQIGTVITLGVTNWADYPAEMFKLIPDTTPGLKTPRMAPRLVMTLLFDGNFAAGYEFPDAEKFKSFGAVVQKGQKAPKKIGILLVDREKHHTYRSNDVPMPPIEGEPAVKPGAPLALLDPFEGQPKEIFKLATKQIIGDFCLLPGNREVIVSGPKVIKLDLASGETLTNYDPQSVDNGPWGLTFLRISPDHKQLFGVRRGQNVIRMWDVERGLVLSQFEGHTDMINGLAVVAGGKKLLSLDRKSLRLWDVSKRQEEFRSDAKDKDFYRGLTVSPDGKRALVARGTVLDLWDLGKMVKEKTISLPFAHIPGHVIALAADGSFAVTGNVNGANKQILCFGKLSGGPVQSKITDYHIESMAFSPDGKYLAEFGGNKALFHLWDVETHKLVYEAPGSCGPILALRFSDDGRLLQSADFDGTIRVWQMPTKFVTAQAN